MLDMIYKILKFVDNFVDFQTSNQIFRTSEFGTYIESCFASTIENILEEALNGEVLLTARPRVVALPPSNNFINENRF